MADKFQSGNAVQLKSGGPKMTISRKNPFHPGHYDCKWFAGSKLNEGLFAEDELQPYEDGAERRQVHESCFRRTGSSLDA
jgi:uncharacterized protein YodC (DUF2158 family)